MNFKIEYKDGSKPKRFVPKSLTQTNRDLFFFDYYAYRCGNEETLIKNIQYLTNSDKEIKSVRIDYHRNAKTRNHNPYMIIFDNPYLNELYESKDGKFKSIKQTTHGEVLLDPKSDAYKDMVDYVFDELEKDHNFFTSVICKHNKDLVDVFNQYALIKENERIGLTNEENNELLDKKSHIKRALMEYSNFRWMAIDRHNYELKEDKEEEKIRKQEEKEFKKALKELAKEDKDKPKAEPKGKEEYLEEYNQELDEYLSIDEYNGMTSDETVVEIPRKVL